MTNITILKDMDSALTDLNVMMMDIYTLARTFRAMDWDKDGKVFLNYSGDFHTVTYVNFFKTLEGCKEIDSYGYGEINHILAMTGNLNQEMLNFKFENYFGDQLFK